MKSQWIVHEEDKELQDLISNKCNISKITSQILINRGFTEPNVVEDFLNINLSNLSFPLLLKDLEKACDRIIFAFKKNEKIIIYGDYDVDGVTSVSILLNFFRQINANNIFYYIPDRLEEGYGLNKKAIKNFKEQNISLIITVDCGIGNIEEVEYAKSLGIDVIITDHHEVPDELPPAYAILNPKQEDCNFPFKELAGVGIAFYLTTGLRMKLRDINFWKNKNEEINLKNSLDLVALGTIADICPLRRDNRILVKYGLSELENTQKEGLKALKQICKIKEGQINYWNVGYRLAPRINAAGRLDEAKIGVELLTTNDYSKALKISAYLDKNNYERQQIEEKIFREAIAMIEKNEKLKNKKSFVLYSDRWHEGVIGIVASKIVEKYYRPTILITFKNGTGKGSGRSIQDFNLYEGLSICSQYLENFGGHKYAAGLSIKKENLFDFIEAFESVVEKNTTKKSFIKKYYIDKIVDFSDVNDNLLEEFEKLEPFGPSNSEPTLMSEDVLVTAVKVFGVNHLYLTVEQGNIAFEALAFNKINENITIGDSLNITYYPYHFKENGKSSIKLKIKEIEKV